MMDLIRRIFRSRRFHHRSAGPVVINPDVAETIHIWGIK